MDVAMGAPAMEGKGDESSPGSAESQGLRTEVRGQRMSL